MAVSKQMHAPTYLREARLAAGYASRSTAATIAPYSPETIGRHERGEVPMSPSDAVAYARCYHAPALMWHYCSDCPVGRQIGRTAKERPLPEATLRIRRMIALGQGVTSTLEEIAFDGLVDASKRTRYNEALKFLQVLDSAIADMMLAKIENEKAATGGNGDGQQMEEKSDR